jgi:hypothetical protein
MEYYQDRECRSGSCKIIDRTYTNKRATSEPVQVFGETNRIISSPHRELIIKELSEKYKKK